MKFWLLFVLILSPWSLMAMTIDQAVNQTITTNPQMIERIENYKASLHGLDVAKSAYQPVIDLSLSGGTEKSVTASNAFEETRLTRSEGLLTAKQILFSGMETTYTIAEQDAEVLFAEFSVQEKATELALRAANVYLDLMRQQILLDLAKQKVTIHERIIEQIKLKTQAGVGRNSDYQQTVSRLELARSNYLGALKKYRGAEISFHRVVGQAINQMAMAKPQRAGLPAEAAESLVDYALQNNPSVLMAKVNVEKRQASYRKTKSKFLPTVNLEFSKNFQNNISGREGRQESEKLMLVFNYNLYSGGAHKASRKKAATQTEQAKLDLLDVQQRVREETLLSWNFYTAAIQQTESLQKHIDASKNTMDDYGKEYSLGYRSLIDLLNIEQEYTSAQVAYANAEFDGLSAYFHLLANTGAMSKIMTIAFDSEAVRSLH